MNPALWFLFRRMLVTSLLERVRRLRQPRYAVFAGLGALYFLFLCGTQLMGGRHGPAPLPDPSTDLLLEWGLVAGVALFSATAWLLPSKAPGLPFTEVEVAHLFPAPLRRSDLVKWKVLDLQKGLVLSSAFIAVFTALRSGPFRALVVALGAWITLNCLALHHAGARYAQSSALSHGIRGWAFLARPLLALAGAAVALVALAPALPALPAGARFDDALPAYREWLEAFTESPAAWILLPFRLVARVGLARDPLELLARLPGALAVAGLLYAWVVRTDAAFEETAAAHAADLARKVEAIRKGRPFSAAASGGDGPARKPPWRLSPVGGPAGAFAWRSAAAALQGIRPQFLGVIVMVVVLGLVIGTKEFGDRGGGLLARGIVGALAGLAAGLVAFLGPGHLGGGLRHDLERLELLKSLPLRGAVALRCQALAASLPSAVAAAACAAVAAGVLPVPPKADIPEGMRLAGGLAAACAAVAVATLAGTLDTAAVLLFPAWFRTPTGSEGAAPGGVEAMGSQMVQGLVRWLGLSLALIPPAGIGLALGFGTAVLLPAGGLAAGVVLGAAGGLSVAVVEAWVACAALGDRWDALDPSEEGLVR